jgi:hypothetical protein
MGNNNNQIDYGDEITSWFVPEHEKYERTRLWYIIAISVALLLLLFSFLTLNFLFAVIVVVAALIIILREGREPEKVKFTITDEGIMIGKSFYDYDIIQNFSIVYKPRQDVKNLYFEFKNVVQPRRSIPLENMNPLPIRENLLKYLPEDLERTNMPLSEALSRIIKI